jgi:tetratricopeptide (TPR) repeat protein
MNKLSQQCDLLGPVPTSSTKSVSNLAIYEECLAIRRRLAKVDPRNTQWQHDEACLLDQIGDEYRNERMKRQAIGAYEASLAVLRHLAEIDPRNTQRQLDVAISLNKLGDVKLDGIDSWGAITCYQASVAIWRQLRGREPNNACWHSNIAQSLEKIGDIKFTAGDTRGALTAYEEMLEVDRALVEIDGTNIEWQLNLSSSLERMGDVRFALDHAISTVAAYEESVAIRRRLIELDGSNIEWPEQVSYIVKKIDHAKRAEQHRIADHHLIDIAAPTTLRAEKESVSLNGEEVIARAKHLLLSFFPLIKPTRTRWRGKPLLLKKLTKGATAVLRSFQRASQIRQSPPKEVKLQESITASHGCESIQADGDGVSAIAVLSSDPAPNRDDTKASNEASIKRRHRRRRHRKRKGQHSNMQHSPPGKNARHPISKH